MRVDPHAGMFRLHRAQAPCRPGPGIPRRIPFPFPEIEELAGAPAIWRRAASSSRGAVESAGHFQDSWALCAARQTYTETPLHLSLLQGVKVTPQVLE